ncbi:MAG: methyltransferase domain-containing protein [Proteobacteria bacterium]|jgi:predicted nicotinamide N-methyase|nr:methyltransferase domain-containing protein [Desulfocapsa sp.]MBU3946140.1 methyltransferase domain-containing protein [Pseudomonadota bacterium]MCG2742375.1 protein N-lysine methyltransferase family protein [Desulfobacteraceae bacterium]MDO8947166.1 methyltransferase domain-containing protein [Desulfocapsaceae bacterium]MBU3984208.1 methyltransferase domain-containing protein [Pseudomonadota bacterium]
MDIRTLPEQERDIYNKIKARYKLTFDRLKVGDKTLRFLKIADIEELLAGKDPFANVSEFPFWVKLWEAAMVLSYVMSRLPEPQGKTVLELGAGLGAPGLAAAAAGFDVTISDYEDIIMDFQRVSAAASGLHNITFTHLDWLNPPELAPFDILTGAEILFQEEFFEPLLNIFKKYLKPDGFIYLAHDARRRSLPLFLELAKKDFDITLNKQVIKKEGRQITIIVNRLHRKKV